MADYLDALARFVAETRLAELADARAGAGVDAVRDLEAVKGGRELTALPGG